MISNILHDKYSNYHYCIVRDCKNTSIKTPGKLWIRVPSEINMRNAWLKMANRDPSTLSTKTQMYFCEDHFDLENDMLNYMQYNLMGSVKKIHMKPGCIPSRFVCHLKKHKLTQASDDITEADKKRAKLTLIGDNTQATSNIKNSTSSFSEEQLNKEVVPSCSLSLVVQSLDKAVQVVQHNSLFRDQAVQVQPVQQHVTCQVIQYHAHKKIQTTLTKHFRSKQIQCSANVRDVGSSPIKLVSHSSTATSPKKTAQERSNKPFVSGPLHSKRKLLFFSEEKCNSDVSYTPSLAGSSLDSSPSKPSSQTTVDSYAQKKDQKLNLHSTMTKILQKPRLYIGIPKKLYYIVDIIAKHTNLLEKHILLCLMKIRLNKTFSQLADDFDISLSQASKIFVNKISIIVSVLLPFIKTSNKTSIIKNLPIAFRNKYNKVNCIIDCLEIEIQKPKKALHQALTWSEYKKANTFKYLIACTPDGLVSFVSAGCGGRISDVNLLEHSQFLDSLEPGSCILADRGFKHLEKHLKQRGFTLLRPPSVSAGLKLSRDEVRQTKEIASLRIHVERVIRRIREFSMLKPHSVVNLNLVNILDFCVTTACSLINIQDSLIK